MPGYDMSPPAGGELVGKWREPLRFRAVMELGAQTVYLMRASLAPGGNFQKYIYWNSEGGADLTGSGSGEDPGDLLAIGVLRITG